MIDSQRTLYRLFKLENIAWFFQVGQNMLIWDFKFDNGVNDLVWRFLQVPFHIKPFIYLSQLILI